MSYISIIIPAYNEENYIRKTLHSIKNQTYQNYEVIVVANGCTDKTKELVEKRASSKVKCFGMNVANVSRARNYGAGKASGEILIFLDADTLLTEDALLTIKNKFSEEHSIATTLVKADIERFRYKLAMNFKNWHNKKGFYKGCSGVLICRKNDFEEVNGYNPEIIVKEHHKLTSKLLEKGKYLCIDTYAITSARRLENWGIGKMAGFWIKQWLKDKIGKLPKTIYEEIR